MGKNLAVAKDVFLFCDGGSCQKAGSEAVIRSIRAYLRNTGQWDSTHTIKTRCNGRCEDAPTCIVQPHFWYKELTPKKGLQIVESHILHQKPVNEYLLYQEHWEEVKSDRQISPFKPKPFKIQEDQQLGVCAITKGLASDQYTYPLFLYLKENSPSSSLELPISQKIEFSEITEVVYNKTYTLELETKEKTIDFVIGPIDQKDKDLVAQRIASVEYFEQLSTNKKGVRLKNKWGDLIAFIWLDNNAWDYCLQIQLMGITSIA
ncbi:(2Fe-2S) ferredoxin domain-containing protein [Flammeovirga pacifica]|uniref:(2Fe-2S) ferredoxin domain-containing protein n=1 Tax=Flammeovirga pacifica TaxID=915059 RepID=A0A1S1YY06_FLAPC|nr:(2Fe-2S) ferredoxin domain-containing protein [Flammeovirga pacifica]OHX65870.1 hypothetical protein NH26_05645 [Flammeovirga pacifica]